MRPKFREAKQEGAQTSRPDYTIRVLQRAMRVLDALLEAQAPLNLDQICQRAQLPKATAYRIIVNLLQGGYLVDTDEGYWLGLKLLRFGAVVEEKLDLVQQARPFLTQLRDRVSETVHLAMLDPDLRVIQLERYFTPHATVVVMTRDGLGPPMHCTALGKAMAAFRPEGEIRDWIHEHGLEARTAATITDEESFIHEMRDIRSQGYATDVDEFEVGIRCVGAPIYDRTGEAIAAVSVSGPSSRMPDPLVGSDVAMQLLETTQGISRALGYTGNRT